MSYFLEALKKYATFSGRARRKEYWFFELFYMIILIVVLLIDMNLTGGVIYGLVALAFIVPSLAVAVRRLHDIDKSGWWFFIGLIPIAGPIWYLILLCTDSTPGPNRFGENPK